MSEERVHDHLFGVCIWDLPAYAHYTAAYPQYVFEILDHAGLPYRHVAPVDLAAQLPGLRLLLTIGEYALPGELAEALASWVGHGGAWLSIAGTCGLADLFGTVIEPAPFQAYSWAPTLGEGYLLPAAEPHRMLEHVALSLHFFNGIAVRPSAGRVLAQALDAHGRETGRAAVVETRPGSGHCMLIAADLTGAVVRVQQGTAVTRDGVGAPDGTAPVGDGILKTDDGLALDWIFDRQPVPGAGGMQAFLQPVADLWREILLRALFYLAEAQDIALPCLWLYPRNLPALAEISHDTDGNIPELGWRLLEVLREAEVHSTWCVLSPGYPAALIAAIREAGHELAMHYDAFDPEQAWGEANFIAQREFLTELFGGPAPTSNKNHYLRWEGDSEFWAWCERAGVQLDQSKGPSKTGDTAFPFGTCHPYLPIDPAGRLMDVLELPTLTQDLVLTAPYALLAPMLDAALRCHGVLHLLFHPNHIAKPGIAEALLDATAAGRAAGMEWWTAGEVNTWERARRQACWSVSLTGQAAAFTLTAGAALPGATVLWPEARGRGIAINGVPQRLDAVQRWGTAFHCFRLDAEAHHEYTLEET